MKTLFSRQIKLYREMDMVIELARNAQVVVGNDNEFLKQISLLFNRIEVMSAMKDDVELGTLECIEEVARTTCCGNCD